eukprot:UN5143
MLRTVGGQLVVIPGFVLTGYLAMQNGTMKVLRCLIPVTALMLSMGALIKAVRFMWFVAVLEFFLSLTDLYEVPLSRLVTGVARPGKVGEWLSTLGLAMEVAKLLGNAFTVGINTVFMINLHGLRLWWYYPSCGLLILLAALPILGTPKVPTGWGAAAGSRMEQLHMHLAVARAANKWKTVVSARKQTATPP